MVLSSPGMLSPRVRPLLFCLLVAAIALVLPPDVPAADRRQAVADFVQEVWEPGDKGLPHPGVTAFRPSADGYLWIGTFAGLVRFDGVQFQLPPAGVPALSDHVRSIVETPDGALWAATRREGVVRMKGGVHTVFTQKDGLVNNDVRVLAVTRDGTVWAGTSTGLTAIEASGKTRTFTEAEGLATRSVTALFVDGDGSLWAGTTEYGLSRFDGSRFQATRPAIPKEALNEAPPVGMLARSVPAIARDAEGVLWAGTSAGLLRLTAAGTPDAFHAIGAVVALAPARGGGLWAATGSGLARIQGDSVRKYTVQDGLLHDSLLSLHEDADGSLWFGTRVGLARLRPRIIQTYTTRDGLADDLVLCVLEGRNGDLWVGSRSGLSRRRDGTWTTFTQKDGLPHATVRTLAESADGVLWIGTLDGVARYENGRFRHYRGEGSPYAVRAMTIDHEGRLWVGTSEQGIDRLDGDVLRRVAARSSLCAQSSVNHLFARRDGSLWVGGTASVIRLHDGPMECFTETARSRNDVRHFYEDHEGQLWLGSIGGLSRMTNGARQTFAGTSGPFNTIVYGMIEDDRGSLWCATPKGLFQIVKKNIERYADPAAALTLYRSFGTGDGMETPVCVGDGQPTTFRGRDGRLYFATAGGVAVVDPSRIETVSSPPRVYVERLVADQQAVDLGGARRLAAGTRNVQLHFAALSFVAPERVQYRYKLEGFDHGWVDSGNRRDAYYTNLPPGSYRFRVIAANHDGVWNEQGAALDFRLLPHLYQRRWFWPSCVALLVAAVAGAYRFRLAQARAHEVELQRRVDEAVANVQVLRGLLPICASCRRVREDSGYWRQIEAYVMERSQARFSHGICPECWEKLRAENPNLPAYGVRE